MKKSICLVIIMLCVLLTGCNINSRTISRNIDNYASDCESVGNASEFMPDIADIGGYSQIKYTYQRTCYSRFMAFYSDGLALFVKYDKETFIEQKDKILNSYTFLEEPVGSSDTYELPVCEFEYRGYNMKIVPDKEYDYCACKSFLMVGFDEANSQIVYLYFYDSDLDYIAKADEDLNAEMRNLVNEAFAWERF